MLVCMWLFIICLKHFQIMKRFLFLEVFGVLLRSDTPRWLYFTLSSFYYTLAHIWYIICKQLNKANCIWQFIIWFPFTTFLAAKSTHKKLGQPQSVVPCFSSLWSVGYIVKQDFPAVWVKPCVSPTICECHPLLPLPYRLWRSVFVYGVAWGLLLS